MARREPAAATRSGRCASARVCLAECFGHSDYDFKIRQRCDRTGTAEPAALEQLRTIICDLCAYGARARTPFSLLPLGMMSAEYIAGQRPMALKSAVKTMLMVTPSFSPRPTSFSMKYWSRYGVWLGL